ncbi:hypothetical protein Poli38472_009627 [Pythium oligandrum]|uniref:Pectin acetylesterase n=1 Tax=Pythium oligandrum TaxID=41045 RepID=A0A8K1CFL1_PYTOL|nr:hypothetical protein Poli38472_009627 [Pythium oligandrum]|eukprot:TMW62134.1 hypothetical protein Poli38472_009627 [Pythium oligandrum]
MMQRVLSVALALSSFSQLTTAYRPGDEVCVVSADNACPLDKLTPSKVDSSTLIYPGGKTRCAFDDFKDPVTGFSTNATYFFQVFPTEKKDKSKLMLYLQGGGACVDDDTCSFGLQCSLQHNATFLMSATASSAGVLNRTDTNNVFKDWNIVNVPYCTGDVHIGNREGGVHEPAAAASLGQPQCLDNNMTVHFNGFENVNAVFKWALENFPDPEHIVLSGSSAGALAAQFYSKMIAKAWKIQEKKIKYTIISDSYVGVAPDSNPIARTVNFFNACGLDYGLPDDVVKKCEANKATVVGTVAPLVKDTLFSDWLFIDSNADITQRVFYQVFQDGLAGFPFNNPLSPEAFYANMTSILDTYEAISSRIATFTVNSSNHMYFDRPTWYSTPGIESNKMGAIVGDVLAGKYASGSQATAGDSASTSGVPSLAPSVVATSGVISTILGLIFAL